MCVPLSNNYIRASNVKRLSELHASAATGTEGATIRRVRCFTPAARMISLTQGKDFCLKE